MVESVWDCKLFVISKFVQVQGMLYLKNQRPTKNEIINVFAITKCYIRLAFISADV